MTLPDTISTSGTALRWRVVLPVAAAACLFGYAFLSSGYIVTVLGLAVIYAIFCIGLNIFMGYTGQASFGQNAFAALGAYGTAILCVDYGWEPVLALSLTAVMSGVIAVIVGYPTLRLRGHYLAMATFALGLITVEVAVEWTSLTQGYMGIAGIPPLGIAGVDLGSEKSQLVALVILMLIAVWTAQRLRNSRFGRALLAISGSEPAASALGINVAGYKLAAFVIAAIYGSVAGSLLTHFVGFVSPEVFGTSMVVLSFTMLYLGGIGTTWGPVIGAVVVSLLPEQLRGLRDLQDVVYCVILILMLMFAPKGIATLADFIVHLRGKVRPAG